MEELPAWVSSTFSAQLAVLRDSGERLDLEFKSQYPENGRDLAKEIAAFATSQGGMILIGVGDSGELVGIESGGLATVRDDLQKRISGVCRNTVKPAILVSVEWGIESDRVVMGIVVPEGSEPIYYASGVPYLRDLSTSRPAEPHEVVALVKRHLGIVESESTNEAPAWLPKITVALMPVIVLSAQVGERLVDPWFSSWRAQFNYSVVALRDLIADNELSNEMSAELERLSQRVEEVVEFRTYIGSGPKLRTLVSEVSTEAIDYWDRYLGPVLALQYDRQTAEPGIAKCLRILDSLGSRAHKMLFSGQSDEFLAEVAEVGQTLLKIALLHLRATEPDFYLRLAELAQSLHLVETRTLYMDGGQSQEQLMQWVGQLRDKLNELMAEVYGHQE